MSGGKASTYVLASRYGYPLSFSAIAHQETLIRGRKLLSLCRLAATIASASLNESYFTFCLRSNKFLGVPLPGRPFLILLSFVDEDSLCVLRMKAFMIGVLLNTIFASYLDNLAIEIHERATNDIQSSTCSDTVGEEEILPSNDHFEVFEDHFVRPLLEKDSVSDFWTAPVLNAYQDSISDSNLIPLSSLSLTLFQLASIQPQSSPPPVHNFLPMIGPSAVSVLPDIPLALHALNLSKDSSPLLMPSISSDGKEKAVILAPTHIENVIWILIVPWSLVSSFQYSSLPCPPSPLSTSSTRFLEGLFASLQRFTLYLPLELPNVDPNDVTMISNLLLPEAPNQGDTGGLTPTPPVSSPPSCRPKRRSSR